MSSPLDRIEARERVRANGQEMPWVLLTEDEMLALVNVARAAQEMREWLWEEAERDAPPHGWRAREELIEKTDEAFARLCIRLNKKKRKR